MTIDLNLFGTGPMLLLFPLNLVINHMVTLYIRYFFVMGPRYITGLFAAVNGNLFSIIFLTYSILV